jgi:hypothetical protein
VIGEGTRDEEEGEARSEAGVMGEGTRDEEEGEARSEAGVMGEGTRDEEEWREGVGRPRVGSPACPAPGSSS